MPVILPIALALLGTTSPPALPSACSVMTKAEAQAYLGAPISRVMPEEPQPDAEIGSIHTTCTQGAGHR